MTGALGNMLYPGICAVCGRELVRQEEVLCLHCLADMPRTFFFQRNDNPVAQNFWGKIPFSRAASFLFFREGSPYRKLLHKMKYLGQAPIGFFMGRLAGQEILHSPWACDPGILVPVPMLSSKRRKRGYNQAELLAAGIARATGWPMNTTMLKRIKESESQTGKNRVERWMNIRGAFKACDEDEYEERHIILVDDVITTGATLEGCAGAILNACPGTVLSIASLAYVE